MSNNRLVKDLMLKLHDFPHLLPTSLMVEALESMSKRRLGIVCAVDQNFNLLGVFTDGDLRRLLLTHQKPLPSLLSDDLSAHILTNPQTVMMSAAIEEAIEKMESHQIWDLPVVDESGKLHGLLHLHPVVKGFLSSSSQIQ